jgi:hypothetical protein
MEYVPGLAKRCECQDYENQNQAHATRAVQLVLLRAALSHGPVLVADFLPLCAARRASHQLR